jgi:hypothetical protein
MNLNQNSPNFHIIINCCTLSMKVYEQHTQTHLW